MSGYLIGVCAPLFERRVERFISQWGSRFDCPSCYLPRWKSNAARPRSILMFPRYVFLARSEQPLLEQWVKLRDVPGISRLLRSGELPAIIPDDEIERLKKREIEGVVVQKRRPRLRIGQRVRIICGPFVGQKAVYKGEAKRGRERVETPLGLAELPRDNLVAEVG